MNELKGKIALVTGGTGGIGTAICQRLADAGARVMTTYRNHDKAEAWAAEQDFDPILLACDVGDYEDCEEMRAEIESKGRHVDILAANGGQHMH